MKIQLSFAADPLAIRVVRKQLGIAARTVGASDLTARQFELAIGEALTNIYLHAYGGAASPIEVEFECDDSLIVTLHDEGPLRSPAPQFPERPPPPEQGGHYGLFVIKQLMDEVTIIHPRANGTGTTIRLVKYLAPRLVKSVASRSP